MAHSSLQNLYCWNYLVPIRSLNAERIALPAKIMMLSAQCLVCNLLCHSDDHTAPYNISLHLLSQPSQIRFDCCSYMLVAIPGVSQNRRPQHMLLGKRFCSSAHCTKKASAMRRWYKILPDRDSDETLAMLSVYTMRVCLPINLRLHASSQLRRQH